jgi:hypothetical protein
VGSAAIHQRDPRTLVATEGVTELGDQFETGGAASDNDDVMKSAFRHVKAPTCGSLQCMCINTISGDIKKI